MQIYVNQFNEVANDRSHYQGHVRFATSCSQEKVALVTSEHTVISAWTSKIVQEMVLECLIFNQNFDTFFHTLSVNDVKIAKAGRAISRWGGYSVLHKKSLLDHSKYIITSLKQIGVGN